MLQIFEKVRIEKTEYSLTLVETGCLSGEMLLMASYYLWQTAANSANGQRCCYSCWQSFPFQYITNNSSML